MNPPPLFLSLERSCDSSLFPEGAIIVEHETSLSAWEKRVIMGEHVNAFKEDNHGGMIGNRAITGRTGPEHVLPGEVQLLSVEPPPNQNRLYQNKPP